MTAEIIQAQYDTLEEIANRFSHLQDNSENMTRALTQHVGKLQNGGWQGLGSEAFFAEMSDELFPALDRLTHSFETASSTTSAIMLVLQTAEEEAANQFQIDTSGDRDYAGKGKLDDGIRISGFEPTTDTDLFASGGDANDIHPNDITQGSLGDCFFLTSLIVVADQNPDLIRNAIQDNGDNTYTVTFYEDGQPVEITVTAEFPVREVYDKETDTWVVDNNRPHTGSGDSELWPRVMEKAFAQWQGDGDLMKGYQIINEGGQSRNALEYLTNVDSQSTTDMGEHSIQDLADMHANGTAITLSSLNSTREGFWGGVKDIFGNKPGYYDAGTGELHTSHAYWIESIDVENDVIVVRNPWGYADTSTHRIELTYAEFQENFDRIDTNALVETE